MFNVLVVEDDKNLKKLMETYLKKNNYTTFEARNGIQALDIIDKQYIDLVISDIMMPEMDGYELLNELRIANYEIPIMLITAKSDISDKKQGFILGADDYMEKPVDPDILTAKVRALLQRTYGVTLENSLLLSGDITLDQNARKAYLGGELLELNVKEYKLLQLFVQNPGKTLRKEYIFNEIWGMDSFSENQTLTVHVKMLRTKIEENPKEPKRIQTVWGVGYRYEEL